MQITKITLANGTL